MTIDGGESGRGCIGRQRGLRRQVSGVEISPDVDDMSNLRQGKIGQGEIVRGRERDDITFPGDSLNPQEKRGET